MAAQHITVDELASMMGMTATANGKPRSKRKRKLDYEPLPHGMVIAEGVIPGRAVPWKAPTVKRWGKAFPDPSYAKWKNSVRQWARRAMRGRTPYAGPCRLLITAFLHRLPGRPPDATNLGKGIEDGLSGAVYVDDRQVRTPTPTRQWITSELPEHVVWSVIADDDDVLDDPNITRRLSEALAAYGGRP